MMEIAYFITPHGFGHATRMTAVLEALQKKIPDIQPHLFTTVQESLFAETLNNFTVWHMHLDICKHFKGPILIFATEFLIRDTGDTIFPPHFLHELRAVSLPVKDQNKPAQVWICVKFLL